MPKHTFALSVILLIVLFNASAGQTIVVGNDNAVTAKLIMVCQLSPSVII
ncbi:hypothetical protein PVAP13_4NG206500 [Panicum virgatum]|uniref:Uncharacterized protein n=1 Tax=Panicum virgatum TaxID=38727 RepID=A0A8T0T9D6_PANVG|nr:hypothetical protein PVAP13_4NG206500 [Panicum virgatum]